MGQKIFVCSSPGTLGTFIGDMVRGLYDQSGALLNQHTYNTTDPITSEDMFYQHVQWPTLPTQNTAVITSFNFKPDFDRMLTTFPGCKIIVITHDLIDCGIIANTMAKYYYSNEELSGVFYADIMSAHRHLFADYTVSYENLPDKEKEIFISIVRYVVLLDGFHTITVPSNPDIVEIKYKDITRNPSNVKTKLANLTGLEWNEGTEARYHRYMEEFITFQWEKSKKVLPN